MTSTIRTIFKSSNLAFLVVLVAAYLMMLVNLGRPVGAAELALLLGLGILYLWIGTYGFEKVLSIEPRSIKAVYFIVQLLLGGVITFLGGTSGWMVLLPIASHAVVELPRRGFLLLCGLILGIDLLPFFGNVTWTELLVVGLSYASALVFVVVFTQILVSEQRTREEGERLAEELRAANQKLREYAAQVEELAVAQERNRLAREIHDGLGHYLTAVNMQIKAAQAMLEIDPGKAVDSLGNAQSLAQEALADVRRSVAALRASPIESRPLLETLEALVLENRSAGITTELRVDGTPRKLPPQAELALYRVTQEGLTNVRKHAQASCAEVRLSFEAEDRVELAIQDDGAGGNTAEGGFGLLGLRERASLLGGQVRVISRPGKGFRLEVEIPG